MLFSPLPTCSRWDSTQTTERRPGQSARQFEKSAQPGFTGLRKAFAVIEPFAATNHGGQCSSAGLIAGAPCWVKVPVEETVDPAR